MSGSRRYSYAIDTYSPGDPQPTSNNTHPIEDAPFRNSEDRNTNTIANDRHVDRSYNSGFKYPEVFNPKTHVRLLRVTAVNPREVEGHFKSVAVDQLPTTSYSALSYTWGTANTEHDVHRISLCGQEFFIRDNLWKFFIKTRERWQGRLLYIDAISIDQRDVCERSDQVKLMPEIYAHADRVYAWLGCPYENEHEKELEAFSHCLAQDKLGRSWSPDAIFGLAHLCSRTYWTRLWIVQELLLAGNITILYGSMRFDWDDLTRLQRRIRDFDADMDPALSWWSAWAFNPPQTSVHQTHADEHIEHGWESGWRMLYRRSGWKNASKRSGKGQAGAMQHAARHGFALYQAVNYFSDQQCQDPRDKVFALLGLLEPDERAAIVPKYEGGAESLHQLYGQALAVGLRALQRDVEPRALARGYYPDDEYHGFAADLRHALRLKPKAVENYTNAAFRSADFREAFVRNCQRERGRAWHADTARSRAEVESNIVHDFLNLTEHEQSSRKAFRLWAQIQGKQHVTSSALATARSGVFDKNKFSQALGRQGTSYAALVAAARVWTAASRLKRWRPFRG